MSAGASCSSSPTGCDPGTSQPCDFSCGGGAIAPGTRTCNTSRTYDACRMGTGVCMGGGGMGSETFTMRVAIPANFGGGFCPNSGQLSVVFYDGRGCPIGRFDSGTIRVGGTAVACGNSTEARIDRTAVYNSLAKRGYSDVQVYCNGVLYMGMVVGQTARQAGFTAVEVNRDMIPFLRNQLDVQTRVISANMLRVNVGPGPL